MKKYIDPITGEIITKKKALNIAILQGRMLIQESMPLKELKKRFPTDYIKLQDKITYDYLYNYYLGIN